MINRWWKQYEKQKVIFTCVESRNYTERWRDPNLCCSPLNNPSIPRDFFLMKTLAAHCYHWLMKYNNSSAPDAVIKIMIDRSLPPLLQYPLHHSLTSFETMEIGGPPLTCASAMKQIDHLLQIYSSAISKTVEIKKCNFKHCKSVIRTRNAISNKGITQINGWIKIHVSKQMARINGIQKNKRRGSMSPRTFTR